MFWLGDKRGYFNDWITQLWVKATGRRINFKENPWLDGPVGPTRRIGMEVFDDIAARQDLLLKESDKPLGILPFLDVLASDSFDPQLVNHEVRRFYEATAAYELDAWSEWSSPFRFFGWLLSKSFSRRLQQLNVLLSGLDTSRGMTNEVFHWKDPETDGLRYIAWLRRLVGTRDVLYAGSYAPCRLPCHNTVYLRVAFPLPNGNSLVIMKPRAHLDGSLSLVSAGAGFGQAGFYFVVHGQRDEGWVRTVRTLQESIHVYPIAHGEVRADHVFTIWGRVFLQLHYRLRRREMPTGI